MKVSALVTVPLPDPVFVTVNSNCGENVAMTGTADVPMLKVQFAVPLHVPSLQPANTEPPVPTALKVTELPELTFALQEVVQVVPPGEIVTWPVPVPAKVTLTGNELGMKVALTDSAALMVTAQLGFEPAQAPLQLAKAEAADKGAAVSVTTVPLL